MDLRKFYSPELTPWYGESDRILLWAMNKNHGHISAIVIWCQEYDQKLWSCSGCPNLISRKCPRCTPDFTNILLILQMLCRFYRCSEDFKVNISTLEMPSQFYRCYILQITFRFYKSSPEFSAAFPILQMPSWSYRCTLNFNKYPPDFRNPIPILQLP